MEQNILDKTIPISHATILVTGGTGLVGSHLLMHLLKEEKKIKALYRNTIPEFEGRDKIEWLKGDILDIIFLQEAMKDVEYVYHCAAAVSFNSKDKHVMYATNVEGTINVVNAGLIAGIKKLCYVSSVAVLGKNSKVKFINEGLTADINSFDSNYARSKYLAEVEVWRGIGEGLEAVIVNPSIILGYANWNFSSAKIFKTAYEEFPWYTEGVTGFIYVKDVIKAMVMLMDSKITGERFIVSSENISFKQIFSTIATGFGKQPPTKRVSPFLAMVVRRYESLKGFFTDREPLLTKETAKAAQSFVYYENKKLITFLSSFTFTPIDKAINIICKEFIEKDNLT